MSRYIYSGRGKFALSYAKLFTFGKDIVLEKSQLKVEEI